MIGWKYDKVETEEVLLPFTKPEDTLEEVENNWSDFGCVWYEQAKRGSRWQASMLQYWSIVQERNGLEKSIWESPTNKKVIEIVGMIEIAQETIVHI